MVSAKPRRGKLWEALQPSSAAGSRLGGCFSWPNGCCYTADALSQWDCTGRTSTCQPTNPPSHGLWAKKLGVQRPTGFASTLCCYFKLHKLPMSRETVPHPADAHWPAARHSNPWTGVVLVVVLSWCWGMRVTMYPSAAEGKGLVQGSRWRLPAPFGGRRAVQARRVGQLLRDCPLAAHVCGQLAQKKQGSHDGLRGSFVSPPSKACQDDMAKPHGQDGPRHLTVWLNPMGSASLPPPRGTARRCTARLEQSASAARMQRARHRRPACVGPASRSRATAPPPLRFPSEHDSP